MDPSVKPTLFPDGGSIQGRNPQMGGHVRKTPLHWGGKDEALGKGVPVCRNRLAARSAMVQLWSAQLKNSAAMSSSYDKVRGGKLSFKGGLGPEKTLDKKKKHKKKNINKDPKQQEGDAVEEVNVDAKEKEKEVLDAKARDAIDTGTGHAPDGKKSKKYEELFPVETKRFGYVVPKVKSREAALDERVKKKADRYCK